MRLEILNRLEATPTGMRGRNQFNPVPFLKIEADKTGKVTPYTLDANEEWCLTAKLTVTFWANSAQFVRARGIAERALVSRLYADVLGEVNKLRLQISNGDQSACMEICDRIESKLTK